MTERLLTLELKLCPFCGSEAKLIDLNPHDLGGQNAGISRPAVACRGPGTCGAVISHRSKHATITAWNTRYE
jgi:Lar family restriction alleviation protein